VKIMREAKAIPLSTKALDVLPILLEYHAIHLLECASELAKKEGFNEISGSNLVQASDDTNVPNGGKYITEVYHRDYR
jgi:hypothetical protein